MTQGSFGAGLLRRARPWRRFVGAAGAIAGGLRLAPAALVLALFLAGCSGLSPQKPIGPDPNASCDGSITVFSPVGSGLASVGTDTTLDLATWNLEFFPLRLPGDFTCPHPNDQDRITKMAELVNTLNLDVIAVQEVSNADGFQQMLALCPDFEGVLESEPHGCNYQRTGVIYRKSIATLNAFRTLTELSVFTREPTEADFTVTQSGRSYRFRLISLHLKAGGETDAPRRRSETTALHAYLEGKATTEPGLDYIVAGDWNDVLTDPMNITSFPAFLSDPENFSFVTDPLKSIPSMASLGTRLIDLILVNRSACPDFSGARVATLRLDLLVSGYGNISDHRPVMVQAPVFK